MDMVEIIKDAFLFPSKDIKLLLIYELLAVLAAGFLGIGTLVYVLGFVSPECFLWGGLAVVISLVIGWVLSGYLISVIKSGIELEDNAPEFEWWDNFITGFSNFIVSIVYFIIPALIVLFVGIATNVYGNFIEVAMEFYAQVLSVYLGTSTVIAYDAIAPAMVNLMVSLSITIAVGIIVFVIFAFLQTMAEARLANTGSLSEALNVFEAAKDIARIGVAKVIVLILLVCVVIGVIQMVLSVIFNVLPILSILSIIITPYLVFFAHRAIGLLYSDIA